MYVINGITGNTGAAAADALLRAGQAVRAIVRDAGRASHWANRGVELIEADLNDTQSLARAFDGADGTYVLVPPDLHHPDPLDHYRRIAQSVSEAASASGLPRIVFLSSEGAHQPAGTGPILGAHFAEAILADAAPDVIFLRPTFFQENWQPLFAVALAQGILPSFVQPLDQKRSAVATRDIGETAASLLVETAPPAIVELTGPEEYSVADAARVMTRVLGREIVLVAVPREAWAATLAQSGVGPAYAALICELYDGINSGHIRASGEGEARSGRVKLSDTIAEWAAKTARVPG